jgi:hypothetical protein
MAIPPSPLPAAEVAQLLNATRQQVAATLASAIMVSSGRPYSIGQALEIMQDIQNAMYPMPQHGVYQEWAKTREARLAKIYGPTGG